MSPGVSVRCASCGERERTRHVEDGDCRECRGIDVPERVDATGYVSPDAVERRGEAIDHAEQRSRHRVISNAVNCNE